LARETSYNIEAKELNLLKSGVSRKKEKSRLRRIIWLVIGLILLLLAYLILGIQWMRYTAQRAGLVDPTSSYRETLDGQGPCPPLTVVVLGDSTAIGTGTSARNQTFSYQLIRENLLTIYSQVNYINLAVSGAVIKEVADEQLLRMFTQSPGDSRKPDLILISIGANDVTGLTSAGDFSAKLAQVLDKLTQDTQAQIVLLGVPAVYSAPVLLPLFPSLLDGFTHRLIEAEDQLLTRYPTNRIRKVDIYNTTGPLFKNHPEYFAADGYHPNDKGYAAWTKEIAKILPPEIAQKRC